MFAAVSSTGFGSHGLDRDAVAVSRPRASRLAPDTRGPADPIPPFLFFFSLTKQLGTHGRGKKKREEMGELIRKMAAKGRTAA